MEFSFGPNGLRLSDAQEDEARSAAVTRVLMEHQDELHKYLVEERTKKVHWVQLMWKRAQEGNLPPGL